MTDEMPQQVRGSTGGGDLGSVPLIEFLHELERKQDTRWRALLAESQTWREKHAMEIKTWRDAHEKLHQTELMELTILKQNIDDRTTTRQRTHEMVHQTESEHDDKLRAMHDELHKALADQIRVANDERKQRDAQQNEWRATLNDVTARMPNRDVTDSLSERVAKIELAIANMQGRMAMVAIFLTVLMFAIGIAFQFIE